MGVKNAIIVGKELEAIGKRLKGIRIDSSDLALESADARNELAKANMSYVDIVLSSDLDEVKIDQLKKDKAECDTWAVGTAEATSSDYPNLPIVYKLAQRQTKEGAMMPCIKVAEGKVTLPGLKQVYRVVDPATNTAVRDVIALAEENANDIRINGDVRIENAMPLLEKVMEKGKVLKTSPTLK
jgi:nicotinate phosphoribosyltransferase